MRMGRGAQSYGGFTGTPAWGQGIVMAVGKDNREALVSLQGHVP